MHFNSSQSRSAWTEQEDDLLRNAVGIYGERSWANVAQMVPGRSSKSCSDRWRNFLSPDIEHPRKSPFTEWEIAVVVLAQARYGNNWKAISMLLPGRTNRAVKNLFVGNLKWGARLPEIRNRFLEWGMTLESLLEIKPDRAGGPVKPRPGQVLPDGTGSQDGSPLSGSPASTSSAGSAWQSDMTEHPNGSPGSANTSERRRRAEGDMAVNPGQSSPVPKRRRGAQSPVLGGLQHMQSPSLAPHPGALGPSFNGGTGSPTLGLNHPAGAMGPPANRAPGSFVAMDPTGNLVLAKQPMGSSNGSNDGTTLILAPGSETTPTSDLTTGADGCAALTPSSALSTGLSGGCFGAGAAAMGMLQQPFGARASSTPCGGLQQLLLSGDSGAASRIPSWHYPGQLFAAAPMGALLDPAAAAAMVVARPASPFQQPGAQLSAVSASNIPGSLTSLLTDGSDTTASLTAAAGQAGAAAGAVKSECGATAAGAFQMQPQQHWLHQQPQQQQQHLHHHHHLQHQQQHQQQHVHQLGGGAPATQHEASGHAAAARMQGMHGSSSTGLQGVQMPGGGSHHHHQHQHHGHDATTASVVASAAMDLPMPGSPVLAGNILTDMRSNDSAGLHSMLDQILNEELNMADSDLALLGGSDGLSGMPAQRSSAFDPPVISLPNPQDSSAAGAAPPPQASLRAASPLPPQAPPPTPAGGIVPGANLLLGVAGGLAGGLSPAAGGNSSGQMGLSGNGAWGSGGSNSSSAFMQQDVPAAAVQAGQSSSQGNAAAAPIKSEPAATALQANPADVQMHRAGSIGGAVQQQQQGMPSRPGSSAGMAPASTSSMQAPSPSPEPVMTPDMNMLCAQLQQENLLLMHKLHHLETQMAGSSKPGCPSSTSTGGAPAATPTAAAGASAGPSSTGHPPRHPASSPAPAETASQQAAPALPSALHGSAAAQQTQAQVAPSYMGGNSSGFDALMPQLRAVLTRVGGSTGGMSGAGADLTVSAGGAVVADSPAQLINTAFLDNDHELLGGL